MTEETRTLVVELKSGDLRKITIPQKWTGPVAIGTARNGTESPNVLRIYTDVARKDLVSVYQNVLSVSDERVQVVEKKIIKKQKTWNKKGSNGEQVYAAEVRKTTWTNPYSEEPEAEEADFDEDVLRLPDGLSD